MVTHDAVDFAGCPIFIYIVIICVLRNKMMKMMYAVIIIHADRHFVDSHTSIVGMY